MRLTRRAAVKAVLAACGGVAGAGAYGFLLERHAVRTTAATASVRGLPSALAGLKIGLLTDVHHSRWVSVDDVSHGVQALMSTSPDLIVLGGDYVTWGDRRYVESCAEALSGLSAPHGVFAILGNHDDDQDMANALIRRGIHVLRDSKSQLSIRNECLTLVGVRFWTRRLADIRSVVRGAAGFVVLLAHDPRRIIEAAALNIPLVLSGHTHGGQVVLPVIGPVAGRKFPVSEGLAQQNQTVIFVSRGLGTVYVPIRVNCPPEVALLTLQQAPVDAQPRS